MNSTPDWPSLPPPLDQLHPWLQARVSGVPAQEIADHYDVPVDDVTTAVQRALDTAGYAGWPDHEVIHALRRETLTLIEPGHRFPPPTAPPPDDHTDTHPGPTPDPKATP
ncbi:hypothetical protein [Gordonia neofelifaecis]|uniref:Uncharacterized protein n=1 Tax=Gordonia neofelifaecis NRRL B-59395 TaxID=644548 RepID=F1YEB3_9ACTN|nr:hypothetical protein [Gordonia neofelifaecis]EGD56746.1 hypothetical protein SCNU_00170 [Gordonia neofelifaecis NRRL B-59395]